MHWKSVLTMLVTGFAQLATRHIAVALERRVDARLLDGGGFALFALGLGASTFETASIRQVRQRHANRSAGTSRPNMIAAPRIDLRGQKQSGCKLCCSRMCFAPIKCNERSPHRSAILRQRDAPAQTANWRDRKLSNAGDQHGRTDFQCIVSRTNAKKPV